MSEPLKFFVDLGVGKDVESLLTELRFDMKTVRFLDRFMSDEAIIELSNKEQRIIITMDKDFGELVFRSGYGHSGVLLLRLEDTIGAEKRKVVEEILKTFSDKLSNNFCVYQAGKFRVRKIYWSF